MKYSWSYKDLKKRYVMLERRLKSKTLSMEDRTLITVDMEEISNALEMLLTKPELETMPMIDALLSEYEFLSYYQFLWEDCILFAQSITDRYNNKYNPPKHDLSIDELMGVVHDFYKDKIGGFFYQMFLRDFNKRFNHVRFVCDKDIDGCTYHIGYFKESFIEMYLHNNFLDIVTLIHEYGHIIFFQTNYYSQASMSLVPFWEIVPMFIESIAYECFSKDDNFGQVALKTKLTDRGGLLNNAYHLGTLINLFQKIGVDDISSNGELRHQARMNGINEKDLISSLNVMPSSSFQYIISFLVVIELLDIYHQDKEKAFYLLRKIMDIKTLDLKEYYLELSKLGIHLCEHTNSFQQELKRELKRI